MNIRFVETLMDNTAFPPEAKLFLAEALSLIQEKGKEPLFDGLVDLYFSCGHDLSVMQSSIDFFAVEFGLSPYTLWLLVLAASAERVYEPYLSSGMPEEVFWDTFSDLRCKAIECKEIHDVWGTFVAHWYPIFYTHNIVKLGRLEYENHPFPGKDGESVTVAGITLTAGDPVLSLHIPSSGEPFDRQARLASYRMAYDYFADRLKGQPLIGICHSWLLYPDYETVFPEGGNIASFRQDFHILGCDTEEEFHDAWRVFGRDYQKPAEELPEDTALRRAMKQHLMSHGKSGEGFGVLIFDGTKLL